MPLRSRQWWKPKHSRRKVVFGNIAVNRWPGKDTLIFSYASAGLKYLNAFRYPLNRLLPGLVAAMMVLFQSFVINRNSNKKWK